MHRVFVSSTFEDLREHRATVREAVRRLGAIDVAMEHWGARSERPKDECLRVIREECDLFVAIYAHRYGFVPPADTFGITESEYREAVRNGLPTFIYLVDEDFDWPDDAREGGDGARKLAALKRELMNAHIVGKFTTPDNLASHVAGDLGRHFAGLRDAAPEIHGKLLAPSEDWVSPVRRNPWRYKLAAFDLDGTLVRGDHFTFSWEAVWKHLGFAAGVQRELKREYARRSGPEATPNERIDAYRAWCTKAVDHFKSRGLTREQLRESSQGLRLTNNCREALTRLREEGVVIGLVSGGINTFLEDVFPDYADYVDFLFMNELLFDDAGLLAGVRATAYDFQGKAEALDVMCERIGCGATETVFVGDQFNDETIMVRADKAIAYPPRGGVTDTIASARIEEDDLNEVVRHILVE